MTLNARSDVGAAQIAFYIPALLFAYYLIRTKHGFSVLAMRAVALFSAVRIASGAILIVFQNHPRDVDYISAGLALEGSGVIPLVLSTIGFVTLIRTKEFPLSKTFKYVSIVVQIVFYITVILLIIGPSLTSRYQDDNFVRIGFDISKAGYVCMAALIAWIIGAAIFLWTRKAELTPGDSTTILVGISASIPFLIVRTVYSCLSVFSGNLLNPTWNPLFGDIAPLVVMHSLMEYIVVVIYLAVLFIIPPLKTARASVESTKV